MALSEEVGRRCFPGKDEEFQTELAQGVARIDKFVLQNSDAKPEDLEKFKKDQAHVGAPEALLCQGDGIQIYNAFRAQGGAAIRSFTEKMVSRPGKPTWGTCL